MKTLLYLSLMDHIKTPLDLINGFRFIKNENKNIYLCIKNKQSLYNKNMCYL